MPGCDTSPHNDLYNTGEQRVIGWVLGGAGAVGLAAFLEAAGIAGITTAAGLIIALAIAIAAAAGAVLGFFIGFAVNWFDRLHVQDPSEITVAGCVLCAGKNTGVPPFSDNDWTFNLGEPLAVINPIIVGLDMNEVRLRSAPGAGATQLIMDAGSMKTAFHCEIGSNIGSAAAVGAAVGSVAGAVAGAVVGAVICAALGLLTFGIGAALCLLVVAISLLVGAAVGGIVGNTIGGLIGWLADALSDFNERGEAVQAGCIMNLTGRWITDASHGHNEIHDVTSAQLIECNACDEEKTGTGSSGLIAAVGIGRHPTGRDP
jgi:hypothetical protein